MPNNKRRSQKKAENESRQSMKGLRISGGLVAAGFLIAVTAQYFAPDFDHQNANLISLAAIALPTLFLLITIYRAEWGGGHRLRLPALILVVLVGLGICYRFEGFSGTMVPQFSYRFGNSSDFELETLETTEQADPEGMPTDDLHLAFESPQFLGPNRNGVYGERVFDIPSDPQEVKTVWSHGIGQGWSSFAVSGEYAVTLEQRDEKECLTCYRLADGDLVWMVQNDGSHYNALGGTGPRSTPTIVDGRVYASTPTGKLLCVDFGNGDVIWKQDLFAMAGWDQVAFEIAAPWGYAPSPLIVNDQCVVPLGGPIDGEKSASLIALDVATGEVVWKAGEDQLSYASPMLMTFDGVQQIVSVNEKTVTGHSLAGGEVLWEFDWPGSTNTGATCAAAVYVERDRVLVGKGYGGGSALVQIKHDDGGWSTEDVWRSNRVLKTKFNHTCVQDQTGFGINNGSLQAVDLEKPKADWTQPRGSRCGEGQCVLVGDVLVVQDEQGDVVFVSANKDQYMELLRLDALDSKTWNIPTVAGRFVLVRNDRQAICFEMPAINMIPQEVLDQSFEFLNENADSKTEEPLNGVSNTTEPIDTDVAEEAARE
ncbi:PQQ-binding-like beta-propeller repeat protein [Rhodopirellula sp. MGV]|uniref:outer membrane protein assembly factor BamB family protein n=1 Tax=Rhodopirellula sp. MGV TaxID=2023130 RepID=UPI000B964C01|nr:PQQ-binding-like beta-propeller repeat protein [Rhodopirellula sp. MGV]OYP38483.1 hypothetical protein CGZ80_01650 [Rhodopirellula sp. MGV]PNY33495.1 oxidoreductase [Rhodopirellula baltica]